MKNRKKQLLLNTLILSFGTICTKGIMFLMTPLFTRWLSQSDYGTFDLILTYISLFIPIITLDCGEAVFRFLMDVDETNDKSKSSIITCSIITTLIGCIISFIIVIILAIIFNTKVHLILLLFLLLFVQVFYELLTMILRGIKKINVYTISNILFVISMVFFVFIYVKVCGMGLEGIILGYITGYAVAVFFMILKSKVFSYIRKNSFDVKIEKKMLKYSLPLIPNALSWWVVNVSDRTIVSIVLGSSTNAILAVANKIPNLCQTIFNVFHISWQQNASETINDEDKDKYYTEIMNSMLKTLISVCLIILSCNFIFFEILFTKEYYSAYYQVPILILSIIISMLAQFIGGIYIAQKETKKNGKTTVLAAIINIIVHLSLINFIGIYAATISTFVSYLSLFIIRYCDIKKTIKIKFEKSTLLWFMIFIMFVIVNYINNFYLNIISLLVSFIIFIMINKNMINTILRKIIKRGN